MPYINGNKTTRDLEYVTYKGKCALPISNFFEVISVKQSLQNAGDIYVLRGYQSKLLPPVTFELNSIDVTDERRIITALSNWHFPINSTYYSLVQEYILEGARDVINYSNQSYITDYLGWHFDLPLSTKPEFILGSKTINGSLIENTNKDISFEAGTFGGQLQFIKDEILPYPETRLALSMGMASIVSSLVNQYVDIGTLVVNVSGQSSTGKSTIAQLSASLFGSPKVSNSGLVRTFNATKNSILATCESRNGLPIILDDANANAKEHDKSDLIYQLALGESRARCNQNGTLQRHRQGWSGLAIITSESSLLEDGMFSRGAAVRCIAFDGIRWTRDAAHSDRIKAGTLANYGHVGQRIADYVANLPTEDLLKDHKDFSDKICAKISIKDGFESRISDKLAPIVMSAKYFNDYTKSKSLDIDELINTLVSIYEASVPNRDAASVAYAKLLDFITINQSNFGYKTSLRYEDTRQPRGKTFGLIVNRDEAKYVLVIKPVFDEFCRQCGVAEKTSILKKWRDDGFIVTNEQDHLTVQSKELQARCYKFPFDSIPEIMLGMPDDPVASPSGCPAVHNTELLPVKCDYDDTEALKAVFGTKEASNDGVA